MDTEPSVPAYNVVIATLQEKRGKLWKMTENNMNHNAFNIMDQIRLEQIEQLDDAIAKIRGDANAVQG